MHTGPLQLLLTALVLLGVRPSGGVDATLPCVMQPEHRFDINPYERPHAFAVVAADIDLDGDDDVVATRRAGFGIPWNSAGAYGSGGGRLLPDVRADGNRDE
jgi:hypothetical protein